MNVDVVVLVVLVFFVAGTIKGLIGFGLPTVSIAILAAFLGLIEAMTLMLLPSLITNLFQGLAGKYLIRLIRRYWSMLILEQFLPGLVRHCCRQGMLRRLQ